MKGKKIALSLFLIIGLTITGFATNTKAANTGDTLYFFKFKSRAASESYTPARPKYNATSAYMKVKSITHGGSGATVSVVDLNQNQFNRTWYVTYGDNDDGKEFWIPNWAYEQYGSGVQVRLRAQVGYVYLPQDEWGSEVWWSPDSVGGP